MVPSARRPLRVRRWDGYALVSENRQNTSRLLTPGAQYRRRCHLLGPWTARRFRQTPLRTQHAYFGTRLVQDEGLFDEARRISRRVTAQLVAQDDQFDVLHGAAGTILSFGALYEMSGDQNVLDSMVLCGRHLLEKRSVDAGRTGLRSWRANDGNMLTGFSHGAAGIAYALVRLYGVTREETFLAAAMEAIEYENSHFNSNTHTWADLRDGAQSGEMAGGHVGSWCTGVHGIGLSRVAALKIVQNNVIRADVEEALATCTRSQDSGLDHLCCGNMGRTELYVTAAETFDQGHYLGIASEAAQRVIHRAGSRGGFSLAHSVHPKAGYPSFFRGTSGIGYQLLRIRYPHVIPPVLLWGTASCGRTG